MPAVATDTELRDACKRCFVPLVGTCSKGKLPKERSVGGCVEGKIRLKDGGWKKDCHGMFLRGGGWKCVFHG